MCTFHPGHIRVEAGLFFVVLRLDLPGSSYVLHAAKAGNAADSTLDATCRGAGGADELTAPSDYTRKLPVIQKAGEIECGGIEIEERRVIVETGVKEARTQMQQDGRRNGAVVVQARRPGRNKCAAVTADLRRQTIRVA